MRSSELHAEHERPCLLFRPSTHTNAAPAHGTSSNAVQIHTQYSPSSAADARLGASLASVLAARMVLAHGIGLSCPPVRAQGGGTPPRRGAAFPASPALPGPAAAPPARVAEVAVAVKPAGGHSTPGREAPRAPRSKSVNKPRDAIERYRGRMQYRLLRAGGSR
eukprot:353182-Chlamydomonas_euryale.AAC.35